MIGRHVGYYFASKLFAAVLNLLSMAMFVRIAGSEIYGGYIVAMAWAAIVYSVSLQWLRFAFFASYREDVGPEQIATYLRILLIGLSAFAVAMVFAVWFGVVSVATALAVYVIVSGLAVYDTMHETARIRLQARTVAVGVVTRAILILVLGLAAVYFERSAASLSISFGLAHWGGALALAVSGTAINRSGWSASAAKQFWNSGRPLIPAFAIDSFGLQFDRLMLARYAGLSDVGPYGAVSDFIRQIMIVGSEAISGAYMALARADAVGGREEDSRLILGQAFRAFTMLTTFAFAFVLHFGKPLLSLMFGADIYGAVQPFLIIILATNTMMVFRAYYFSQLLFMDDGARSLLVSNAAHAVVAGVLSVAFIPQYGAPAAAFALMMGHAVALAYYAWIWRGKYVTRLPYGDATAIAVSAAAVFGIMELMSEFAGRNAFVGLLEMVVFGAVALAVAWKFRILSVNELAAPVRSWWAGRRERSAL